MTLTQFKRQLKKTSSRRKVAKLKRWAPLPVALLLLSSVTILGTHQATQLADNRASQTAAKQDATLLKIKQQLETTKSTQATSPSAVAGQDSPLSSPVASAASPASNKLKATGQTKYSTSSDPASTAYSLAPPAANPASFDKPITRNSQYPAGTVVSYNATKGERAVYAGDLGMSLPAVTVSLSSNVGYSPDITITSPDGQTIGMPSKWYADRQPISLGMDASQYHSEGTSFVMRVQAGYGAVAGTTYTIRIHATRTAQTADAYYYDYFLPVTVTP